MHQNRSFDHGDIRRIGRHLTVERNCSSEIGAHSDGKRIGNATAVTEAGHANFAGAIRASFQPLCGGEEILLLLGSINLTEELATLIVITRVAAYGRQPVSGERHESLQSKPAAYVFNVRVQSTILVHDEDAG